MSAPIELLGVAFKVEKKTGYVRPPHLAHVSLFEGEPPHRALNATIEIEVSNEEPTPVPGERWRVTLTREEGRAAA